MINLIITIFIPAYYLLEEFPEIENIKKKS